MSCLPCRRGQAASNILQEGNPAGLVTHIKGVILEDDFTGEGPLDCGAHQAVVGMASAGVQCSSAGLSKYGNKRGKQPDPLFPFRPPVSNASSPPARPLAVVLGGGMRHAGSVVVQIAAVAVAVIELLLGSGWAAAAVGRLGGRRLVGAEAARPQAVLASSCSAGQNPP